jgi:hypothetical protein
MKRHVLVFALTLLGLAVLDCPALAQPGKTPPPPPQVDLPFLQQKQPESQKPDSQKPDSQKPPDSQKQPDSQKPPAAKPPSKPPPPQPPGMKEMRMQQNSPAKSEEKPAENTEEKPPEKTDDNPEKAADEPPARPLTPREELVEKIKAYARSNVQDPGRMLTDVALIKFEDNKVGVKKSEIVEIYEEEYKKESQSGKPAEQTSRTTTVVTPAPTSNAGTVLSLTTAAWIIGILLMGGCLVAFVWILWNNRSEGALDRPIMAMRPHVPRNRKAGSMRRYKTRLVQQFQELKLPIDAGKWPKLREVYVTPRLGASNSEILDVATAVSRYRRFAVKGVPGSGKSLLLRYLALACVDGGDSPFKETLTPVIIELQQLGTSTALEHAIAEQLAHNGVGAAEAFTLAGLQRGALLLLLDGLDEVKSSARPQMLRQIKELLSKFPSCRAVITCRPENSVKELNGALEATLELKEFTDQQVREFMRAWRPTLIGERPFAIEPLIKTLREQEQLLHLARNPLLLTMIVALYAEKPRGFPATRAALYRQCLDATLSKSRADQSRYLKETKFEVLPQLALAMLDRSTLDGENGLTLDRAAVVNEVRRILAEMKRNSPTGIDGADLVRELIERDHVLAVNEGGCRFRHRCWQEYLAAEALEENMASLADRFRTDPDIWLEPAKFCCGLEHNCTSLIEALQEIDSKAALACLAEAKQVDVNLAARVVGVFKDKLGTPDGENGTLHALAGCATHTGQRGEAVFNYLVQTLAGTEPANRRIAAARALALTCLPRAAREIARVYPEGPEFRTALVEMGDQAVLQLAILAKGGSIDALDDLQAIGTPAAAEVLVPMLWESSGELAVRAAWRLAALMHRPDVEQALESYAFSAARPAPGNLDWIWEPFARSDRSIAPLIAGQVASLLERAPAETAPRGRVTMDPRLVLPLCGIVRKQDAWRLTEELPRETKATIRRALIKAVGRMGFNRLGRTPKGSIDAQTREARTQFVALVTHVTQPAKSWQFLLESLPADVQFGFLYGLFCGPTPRRWDWIRLRQPGKRPPWTVPSIQVTAGSRSEAATDRSATTRQNGTGPNTRTDAPSRRPGSGPLRTVKTGAG